MSSHFMRPRGRNINVTECSFKSRMWCLFTATGIYILALDMEELERLEFSVL